MGRSASMREEDDRGRKEGQMEREKGKHRSTKGRNRKGDKGPLMAKE